MNILWHGLFAIHYNESIDEYNDIYKKNISLKYLKNIKPNYMTIELALLKKLLSNKSLTSIMAEIDKLTPLQILHLSNINSIRNRKSSIITIIIFVQ